MQVKKLTGYFWAKKIRFSNDTNPPPLPDANHVKVPINSLLIPIGKQKVTAAQRLYSTFFSCYDDQNCDSQPLLEIYKI